MIVKSNAYDEYWNFALLRQAAFRRNLTPSVIEKYDEDPILQQYKFTNCYRALDRVSQYLIKNVIYSSNWSPEDTFFRVLLFKLFNKIETWQTLEKTVGIISLENFNPSLYCETLDNARQRKEKIYSAAYIMPSGRNEFGSCRKHENNIKLLEQLIKQETHKRIWDYNNLEDSYRLLLKTPTFGPFLAYQYAIDLGYSQHSNTQENQFIIAGPGAIRGIEKCFASLGGKGHSYIIESMTNAQQEEFQNRAIEFPYLQNRLLQLIDIQNLFCEVDKYLRVKRPDLNKGNPRIKQHYKRNFSPIEFTFPPKWKASL